MNETTETGEWLTRGTVWLALALYTGAEVLMSGRCRGGSGRPGRLMNTAGCAVFITHVASAFAFYHHWSHSAAYEGTARQTAQLTGWNWGGGLYVNYLFGLLFRSGFAFPLIVVDGSSGWCSTD